MCEGREVANYVLDYSENNEIILTNLGLQKITFFCHIWFLVSTNKPLIKQNFMGNRVRSLIYDLVISQLTQSPSNQATASE